VAEAVRTRGADEAITATAVILESEGEGSDQRRVLWTLSPGARLKALEKAAQRKWHALQGEHPNAPPLAELAPRPHSVRGQEQFIHKTI
jgi:hypothetical protein